MVNARAVGLLGFAGMCVLSATLLGSSSMWPAEGRSPTGSSALAAPYAPVPSPLGPQHALEDASGKGELSGEQEKVLGAELAKAKADLAALREQRSVEQPKTAKEPAQQAPGGATDELLIYPPDVDNRWCPHGDKFDETITDMPDGFMVDVGAFDGYDAIRYANAGHTVLSVEPSPSKANKIRARLEGLGPLASKINFISAALSDFNGTADFVVSPATEQDSGDADFMNGGGDSIGSQQDAFAVPWEGKSTTHTVQVPVRRLDDLIGPDQDVLFLKVDAQGFDLRVLRGAERLLRERRIKVIQSEFAVTLMPEKKKTALELLGWMKKFGYRCVSCGDDPTVGVKRPPITVPTSATDYVQRIFEQKFEHRGVNHGGWDDIICM